MDMTAGRAAANAPRYLISKRAGNCIRFREWQLNGLRAVAALAVRLPRAELPVWVLHGAEDGLIPAAFTSDACVGWLRSEDRRPR